MNYAEALNYIESTKKYGIKPGLDTINDLLIRLNNPHNNLTYIHVAGTNGKGSTIAYIESILIEAGYKVGKYISPSVFEYEEKIQISGINISKNQISEYITQIKDIIEDMINKGLNHPTSYEIETAMAFLHFNKANCDIVILETGLGGRLDATNIINNTICSVITSITLDHINILGDTPEKIAYEKAGIIKPNSNVVIYEQKSSVMDIIENKAIKEQTKLIKADFSLVTDIIYNDKGITFSYKDFTNLTIHLLGEFQIKNAVVAIETILLLNKSGYIIIKDNIKEGLMKTRWAGRFEIICKDPIFIIDGAHNEDSAKSLKKTIETYYKNKRIIYIIGVLKDKNYTRILNETATIADIIITITPNNPRGLESDKLANIAKEYVTNVIDAKSISNGVKTALTKVKSLNNEAVIIAFGSLTYLGEVKKYMEMYMKGIDYVNWK